MRLALTLPMSDAETPTSWVSRLAQLNGSLHANDFLKDFGLNWRSMTAGSLKQLPQLADLTGHDLGELTRFAVRKAQGKTRMIGREPILSRLLSFQTLKMCPVCAREAFGNNREVLSGSPIYWQLAPMRTCAKHHQALIELPPPETARCKYDIAGRLLDHRLFLQSERPRKERTASDYERYIIGRIKGEPPTNPSWLDHLDLGAIAKTCEHVGELAFGGGDIARSSLSLDDDQRWDFEGRLFHAIRHGPSSLKEILHEIRQRPKTGGEGFRKEFGRFASWISTYAQEARPGVAPLLNCVRDFVEEGFPIAAGQTVLGRECRARKLHSVMSVSHQYGIGHIRVRRLFRTIKEQGGYDDLPPPDSNECVPAKFYDPWLERYSQSWNEKQAGEVLGMRWYRLDELNDADLLSVFINLPGMGRRFESSTISQFIQQVFENSVAVSTPSEGKFPLSEIPNRCVCTSVDVIRAVLEQRLSFVGRDDSKPGLSALVVDQREVLDALEGPPLAGITQAQAFKRWRINTSTMACLVREGILGTVQTKHPRSRRPMKIIPPGEITRFEAEYLTLGCIASMVGKHPVRVLHELRNRNVEPIDLPASISCLYPREKAELYLADPDQR